MPKPTTGRIDRAGSRAAGSPTAVATPQVPAGGGRRRRRRSRMSAEDTNRINESALTALCAGLALFLGTMYFAAFGGVFGFLGGHTGQMRGVQIGFGVGLALGLLGFVLVMRWRQDALRARSQSLYRGVWVGALMALALIALMYYLPHVVFPQYCPPGPGCGMVA